jgi:hypothetical protein
VKHKQVQSGKSRCDLVFETVQYLYGVNPRLPTMALNGSLVLVVWCRRLLHSRLLRWRPAPKCRQPFPEFRVA